MPEIIFIGYQYFIKKEMSVSGHPVPETGVGISPAYFRRPRKNYPCIARFLTACFLLFAVLFLLFSG
jgi:hypothetical protein